MPDMGLDEHQYLVCTITLNQLSKMQTKCVGLSNREQPPDISIHQRLTSWVVTY